MLFANHNIRVKTGRWKVEGKPLTILVDFSQFFFEQGRRAEIPVGELPGRFDQRAVGLYRARAVRGGRRQSDRELRELFLFGDRPGGGSFPRMDDGQRRIVPTETFALRRHGIYHPCDGHGALYRRQRTAAVRRYDAVERRRTGAAVQRGCQTFAGKDVGRQFRLFRDGQRPDGARVPLSARQKRSTSLRRTASRTTLSGKRPSCSRNALRRARR